MEKFKLEYKHIWKAVHSYVQTTHPNLGLSGKSTLTLAFIKQTSFDGVFLNVHWHKWTIKLYGLIILMVSNRYLEYLLVYVCHETKCVGLDTFNIRTLDMYHCTCLSGWFEANHVCTLIKTTDDIIRISPLKGRNRIEDAQQHPTLPTTITSGQLNFILRIRKSYNFLSICSRWSHYSKIKNVWEVHALRRNWLRQTQSSPRHTFPVFFRIFQFRTFNHMAFHSLISREIQRKPCLLGSVIVRAETHYIILLGTIA